ncbi:MAG TPA: hypothetical protein ENI71_03900 [Chromatiales bacterium]|nr:hypothetical protein [Chromatiales bacterium]
MRKLFGTPAKIAVLALVVGLAGGCATTDQLNGANLAAQTAKSTAQAAQSTAQTAKSTANQANQKADEALQQSAANKKAIDATNEKINRMFKKSMYK